MSSPKIPKLMIQAEPCESGHWTRQNGTDDLVQASGVQSIVRDEL
jgi:hypothetical protein